MLPENFFRDVQEVAMLIPPGRITSYAAIANYLGQKGKARMVGWALHRSSELLVPAHRVVNQKGELSGRIHFSSPTAMQEMLEAEGVKVENNKVCNFDQIFWDPSKALY